jgi:hypothetical protein
VVIDFQHSKLIYNQKSFELLALSFGLKKALGFGL